MAFTRKTYTGPVENRGVIERGGKKLADVSKEELDAFRKKAGNEDLSYKEALRKLLNADRNTKRGEDMSEEVKKMPDNRPTAFDDKGVMKRKSPEMMKTDDTSLSLSERMKRTKERARTSNTGTDTRSVSQRIKEAIGMKKGGSVRGDGIAKRGKTKGKMC